MHCVWCEFSAFGASIVDEKRQLDQNIAKHSRPTHLMSILLPILSALTPQSGPLLVGHSPLLSCSLNCFVVNLEQREIVDDDDDNYAKFLVSLVIALQRVVFQ